MITKDLDLELNKELLKLNPDIDLTVLTELDKINLLKEITRIKSKYIIEEFYSIISNY